MIDYLRIVIGRRCDAHYVLKVKALTSEMEDVLMCIAVIFSCPANSSSE